MEPFLCACLGIGRNANVAGSHPIYGGDSRIDIGQFDARPGMSQVAISRTILKFHCASANHRSLW
jgi:hypothetical protein